jgi:hypothetical protein
MNNCYRCRSSGFLVATSKKNGAIYAFVCGCSVSKSKGISRSIPLWSDRFASEFVLDAPETPQAQKEPEQLKSNPQKPAGFVTKDYKKAQANDKAFDDDDLPF